MEMNGFPVARPFYNYTIEGNETTCSRWREHVRTQDALDASTYDPILTVPLYWRIGVASWKQFVPPAMGRQLILDNRTEQVEPQQMFTRATIEPAIQHSCPDLLVAFEAASDS